VKTPPADLDPIFTVRTPLSARSSSIAPHERSTRPMRVKRTLGAAGALIAAALVGGTLISAVSATPGTGSGTGDSLADETVSGEYCQLYLDTLAAELGVGSDALVPAAKAAAIATIEAMVANGDLPSELGDSMIARIEAAEGGGCAVLGLGFHRFVRHAARGEFHEGMLQAAADALNLTIEEVRTQFGDGASLQEMAEAQGVDYETVKAAVIDSASADLTAAVEAGRITQERADAILARIQTWLDNGGQPGPHGWRDGPRGPRGGAGA
jgi:hypothetical protein